MDTFAVILGELGQALLPLRSALQSPESFFAFLLKLGWRADDIPQPLRDVGAGLDTLLEDLRDVLGDVLNVEGSVRPDGATASASIDVGAVARVVQALQQVTSGIRAIASAPDAAIPAPLREDGFKDKFPKQLLDYLIIRYLTRYQSSLAFALRALGVIKATYTPRGGNRPPYVHYSLDLPAIATVLSDPAVVLENAFGWGRSDFDFGGFASQVDNLMSRVGADVFSEVMPTSVALAIEGAPDLPGAPVRKVLRMVLVHRARPSGRMTAELRMMSLPARDGLMPGIALLPAFNGVLDFKMSLGPGIALAIKSDLDLQGGVALQIRPERPIDIIVGFHQAGTPVSASGSIEVIAERSGPDGEPVILLGSPEGTRLQFQKIGGLGGVRLRGGGEVDVFAEFELDGLEFVFDASKSDGFLSKLIPDGGFRFGSDLTVGISYRDGFYFRGTSHLEISVPAHVQIGPIAVLGLTIAANPKDGALPISLGATVKGELGPVKAVVENIGLTAMFKFMPEHDGNLGPLDLSLGVKPPTGAGLTIDAGIVKGGGFVRFDPDHGEYAGALELEFADFLALKAIGLITTRMPDGSSGFSLLIVITAEFPGGLQLGYGFTLLGVGGLLGLNRTMRLDALAEGVRTGAIESVMFPHDVVANAPRILSDLKAFFPPQPGTFLIGPMAKIGWGTPTLISIAVGIVIEIPGNIAIVGVIKVALPTEDEAILLLQVNFIGAIEFDKKRIWFFASLFESRVLTLTIDGELGLLVAYGDEPNFVLTVGGFHPAFVAPPLPFPSPRRVAINILNTDNARIAVSGYFAVTSNTAQFGAAAELYFGFSAFSVQGHIGFDALFRFSPFSFIIEVSASVSLKTFGVGLFSISLRFSLEGPTPWRARGTGSISVLFFEISADFDITWGEERDTTLPSIPVLPLLAAEIAKPEVWRTQSLTGGKPLVILRVLPEAERELVLHPLGTLFVVQRAVPLDIRLDKIGAQAVSDVSRCTIEVASAGIVKRSDPEDRFALAQFQNMDDAAKLSRPAFEREHAGVELGSDGTALASQRVTRRSTRYEEIVIDPIIREARKPSRLTTYNTTLFQHFLQGSSVSRSPLSSAEAALRQPFAETVQVTGDAYVIASTRDNTAAGPTFSSHAQARDYLDDQLAEDPSLADSLHILPVMEVAA